MQPYWLLTAAPPPTNITPSPGQARIYPHRSRSTSRSGMVLCSQPASNLQMTLGWAPSKCSELVELEPLPQEI